MGGYRESASVYKAIILFVGTVKVNIIIYTRSKIKTKYEELQ
jgi:hypothetical protein